MAVLAVTAALFGFLQAEPGLLAPYVDMSELALGSGLLGLVGVSVLIGWQGNGGIGLRQAMNWVAVALMLVIGFGYRDVFTAALEPPQVEQMAASAVQNRPGVVSLGSAGNGHFWADAKVDGTHVRFLVDTGASHIALTPFDAQRLGYDLDELDYRVPYQTANGTAYAAPVTLEEVSIGTITVRDVRASVSQGGLSKSLLGMSFLGELSTMELSGDRLILRE